MNTIRGEMDKYTKRDIIEKIKAWNEEDISERSKYNRLDKIIDFLKEYEKQYKIDSNHEFFKSRLDINLQKLNKRFDGHELKFESAIFLICLCENDNKEYFSKLLKNKRWTKVEFNEWFDSIEKTLNEFKEVYLKKRKEEEWQKFSIMIMSIYQEFYFINNITESINRRIFEIVAKLMAMSADDRNVIYIKSIKNRFDYIDNEIEKFTEKLDSVEKFFYEERLKEYLGVYKIDFNGNLNETLVDLIENIIGLPINKF